MEADAMHGRLLDGQGVVTNKTARLRRKPRRSRGLMIGEARAELLAKLTISGFLILSSIGLTPPAIFGGGEVTTVVMDTGQGAFAKQVLYLILFSTSVFLFTTHRRQRVSPTVMGMLGIGLLWCWISLSWAEFPDIAIRRLVVLTIVLLSMPAIMSALPERKALNYFAALFAGLLIANTLAVMLSSSAVTATAEFDSWSSASGTWRGLHLQKNAAGAIGALGIFFYLYRSSDASQRWQRRVGWIVLAMLALCFVYKTGSKTSFGLVFIASALGMMTIAIAGSPARWGITLLVLAGGIACAFLLDPGLPSSISEYFASIGQDPAAFTGRGQIWPVMFKYAADHPLLGSGFGSFWTVGEGGAMYSYSKDWLLTIAQAHNGYLDMQVQIGAVGLVLTVLAAFIVPVTVLIARSNLARPTRWVTASLIWFFVLHNLFETSLFDRDNPVWMILLCAVAIGTNRPRSSVPA